MKFAFVNELRTSKPGEKRFSNLILKFIISFYFIIRYNKNSLLESFIQELLPLSFFQVSVLSKFLSL